MSYILHDSNYVQVIKTLPHFYGYLSSIFKLTQNMGLLVHRLHVKMESGSKITITEPKGRFLPKINEQKSVSSCMERFQK